MALEGPVAGMSQLRRGSIIAVVVACLAGCSTAAPAGPTIGPPTAAPGAATASEPTSAAGTPLASSVARTYAVDIPEGWLAVDITPTGLQQMADKLRSTWPAVTSALE